MAATVGHSPAPSPRELPESGRASVAKANLRKTDTEAWKPLIGRALARAMALCGWSLKEFAGAVNRDPRQCARWLDGSERLQLDVVFAVPALRQPLVIAIAEIAGDGIDVQTIVTIRRTA